MKLAGFMDRARFLIGWGMPADPLPENVELRIAARLAWNGWPDSVHARKVLVLFLLGPVGFLQTLFLIVRSLLLLWLRHSFHLRPPKALRRSEQYRPRCLRFHLFQNREPE